MNVDLVVEPIIRDRLLDCQNYASSAFNSAISYLNELKNVTQTLGFDVTQVNYEWPEDITVEIPGGVVIPTPPDLDDLIVPDVSWSFSEDPYRSDIADAISAKLLTYLVDGCTGLSEEVEQAIYDRAKARTELENARIYEQALSFWAARGWSVPPGAANAMITEALTEQTRANADINEKILIEQARLAQNNSQFAITSSLSFEGQMKEFIGQVATRALESAKAAVQMPLEIFKSQIALQIGQMDLYKSEAGAYESLMKALLAEVQVKVEAYKGSLERAKGQTELLLKSAEIALTEFVQTRGLLIEAAKGGANVSAQLAASAMSAVHGSFTLSGSESAIVSQAL